MKNFLLLMLGMLLSFPAIARDFSYEYEGQTLTYTVIDEETKTCQTREGTLGMTDEGYLDENASIPGNKVAGGLIIPPVAKDGDTEYTVTALGNCSFIMNDDLQNVVLPTTITSVSMNAFLCCRGIRTIDIPSSVTTIEGGAFMGAGLTSLRIPASVNSIEGGAFTYCYSLEEVIIEDSEKSLTFEYDVFYGSPFKFLYLGRNFTAPSSGGYYDPFTDNDSLTKLTIGDKVTAIDNYAFSGCEALSEVTIPNTVKSIGDYAFSGCKALPAVDLPIAVKSIGNGAFSGCDALTSIIIPPLVKSIGENVFSSSLLKIAMPENLDYKWMHFIPQMVFRYTYDHIIENGCIYNEDKSILWFAQNSLEGEFSIPGSVSEIGKRAFMGCVRLTSISIPESVSSIDAGAFSGCSGLTSISIPETITNINDGTFSYCSGLTSIIIPESISGIGDSAFAYCTGLTSVVIPKSVSRISDYAFAYCMGLTSVVIPESVSAIGEGAFGACTGLTSINIPSSVSEIGRMAFFSTDLTSIEIPNSVRTLSEMTFGDCIHLKEVALPENLESIESGVFWGCEAIEDVYYRGLEPVAASDDIFEADVYYFGKLHVREGRMDSFKTVAPWKFFKTIDEDVYSGIEIVADGNDAAIDFSAAYEIYDLNGIMRGTQLEEMTPGIFLIRQGNKTKKIVIN